MGAILAIGHEGATAGTVTDPTGPVVDIADARQRVDVVMGDHNDLQVISRRANKVLTENRGKGLRFTRVRMLYDTSVKRVVYETADFHKPWNIGVTPDPAIQALINDLNTQLGPIFKR